MGQQGEELHARCMLQPCTGRQVYPNSTALVVSTENITQNWYLSNDRAMLIPNCLFRVGGAAVLLSNKRSDRRRAKCARARSAPLTRAPPSPPRAARAARPNAAGPARRCTGPMRRCAGRCALRGLHARPKRGGRACEAAARAALALAGRRPAAPARPSRGARGAAQVRAEPCGADAHGRVRRVLRLRVPEGGPGGRHRCAGCRPPPPPSASALRCCALPWRQHGARARRRGVQGCMPRSRSPPERSGRDVRSSSACLPSATAAMRARGPAAPLQTAPRITTGARAGVYLSKDLMSIAGHALKANITTLGPLVLPVSEQLLFFISLVMRKARAPAAPLLSESQLRAGLLQAECMQLRHCDTVPTIAAQPRSRTAHSTVHGQTGQHVRPRLCKGCMVQQSRAGCRPRVRPSGLPWLRRC